MWTSSHTHSLLVRHPYHRQSTKSEGREVQQWWNSRVAMANRLPNNLYETYLRAAKQQSHRLICQSSHSSQCSVLRQAVKIEGKIDQRWSSGQHMQEMIGVRVGAVEYLDQIIAQACIIWILVDSDPVESSRIIEFDCKHCHEDNARLEMFPSSLQSLGRSSTHGDPDIITSCIWWLDSKHPI